MATQQAPEAASTRVGFRLDRRLAFLALFALALAFQGSRGIWEPDEGRYTNVALRMLRSGDWLTPTLHAEVPHFTKPPLTYWSIASAVALFGRTEWAARLPNALAYALTVLLVGRMARRLAPGREALAAVVQATSLFPFVAANIVTTDTLLALTTTLAAAGFAEWRFAPDRPTKGLLVMGLGFGLAFLVKGPPGLLPLLPIVATTLRFDGVRGLAALRPGRGFLIFLSVGLWWYLIEVARYPDLLGYFLGAEVAERVASDAFDRNATLLGLVRTYVPVLVLAALPWIPWALARAFRRRGERSETGGPDPAGWFLVVWLLLPFAVFCLSSSRQPLYLLQLAPAASLWIARALPIDVLAPRRRRLALAAWIVVLLALKAGAGWFPNHRDGRAIAAQLARAAPERPGEIVFVQSLPLYSLSFYFDVDVEQIALESVPPIPERPAYRPLSEPLSQELADPEPRRYWLVPIKKEPTFVAELAGLGWRAERTGEVERYAVYADPVRDAPR